MRYLAPILIGLAGCAVLIGLGTWQLQRLAWKETLLADMASRIAAAPAALPAAPDPARDQYLTVAVEGEIGGPEMHVLVGRRQVGAGFRVIAPFETGGRRVLLDRGFVPEAAKDDPRAGGHATVTGNLVWPDERDGSTPENDPAGNLWFARDIDDMAALAGTEPLLVVAREPTGEGIDPWPVGTEGIPNNHRPYAITWFSLAAGWLGMTAYWLWRIYRRTA